MEYQIGTSVFDDWEIVRRIGSGASGVVYEIQKKGQDIALTSALKVMRVPQDPSVVTSLTDEGMDAQGIESYLQGIVNELIDEIKIMASLKGFPYIVSCEDYKVIRDSQNLQWEVLIRMELLQPLSEYQQENDLTETDVRRLGVHLAKSLALFEKQEIIHRDIKPENIFVNEFGDFKVGDFGIARVYDKTTRLLSKKGTENYMAPEVYRGQEYDNTADIYSLGLILYKLLNKNRLPFYPIDKTFTALEQQKALMSRMSGRQELPMPVLASPEFGRIVLKMCAFRAENRYQNAEELLCDLEAIAPSAATVTLRQKSGSALTGRARSREEENLTHAVFSGASKTGGTHNFSTGASNSLQDDLQETPLHIERAGSKTDRSLNYNPDGNAERNAGENANRNAERSAGENTNRNAERSTGKNTDDRADEEVLKKTQSTESRRPGYNPETQMDNKGKTSTAWKQKILMGVAVLAIVLALAIPRILAMKFTLTVNGGSGDGDYKAGVTVTVKAEEQAGSSFTGWEAEGLELSEEELSMEELTIKMPRKAVTLTASYEVNLYTVTVNGGSGSGEYQLNDEVVIEADEPEEGYEFSKWEINSGSPAITDVSAQKLTFSMGEETVEVTSVYEQIDYQLTVNEGEGSGSYHLGDTVSISAEQTQNGMTFSGWTVDGGTLELSDLNVLNVTFTMPAEDLTLTAHYDMEMHTVKVNDGTGNGMYSVGSTVEVSADAVNSQGYAFSSWSVTSGELDTSGLDLSQPELSFTMPASDLVLQANYAEAAAVTATSASYTLTVNGGTGSGSYAAGETISVTHDAPQTGMVFVYWIASGYAGSLNSTADTLEITMPENNVILTAVFAQE